MKLKTKTQNIFCCLNENLTTFLYTLTACQPDKKTTCIQKLNVIKKIWVLVFRFMYLVMDKSIIFVFNTRRLFVPNIDPNLISRLQFRT